MTAHAPDEKNRASRSRGFTPVARHDARVLILGSLPGDKSILERQYYAHPRNAFWPIMADVFDVRGDYAERLDLLTGCFVALWDVLAASIRPGSLDANIDVQSAEVNDFKSFFAFHPQVQTIVFNGKKAQQLFLRNISADLYSDMTMLALPSTSPAHAAMSYATKLQKWQAALKRFQ